MNALLSGLDASASMDEVRAHLGAMLHLDGPVDEAVARRALDDERYAHYLVVTRENPRLLRTILDAATQELPPASGVDAPTSPALPASPPRSTAQLLGSAATALARWGGAGFIHVDAETYERRWSACLACSNLVEPPPTVVYKLASGVLQGDRRVCAACGCLASRKARLPTESCPESDLGDPSLTRWGEPRKKARGSSPR
jgi:hypothetical protein